jgi:hypothetical protein
MTARLPLSFFILLSIIASDSFSQQTLKGKVYTENDSVMAGVNVFNTRSRLSVRTAADGSYALPALEGDRVIFSMAGYRPDTITASFQLLLTQYDPGLKIQTVTLKGVTVFSSYQADSMARRAYYQDAFNQKNIMGGNRPSDGVGVSISPLSYFSRAAKQKRQLKRTVIKQEEDEYIDHSFPREWVNNLTGLTPDSLNLFMYRYRPSYKFCRNTDRMGMLVYINDKLKEFRTGKVTK